jgi:alpha-glucosidase
MTDSAAGHRWWQGAVLYQLYVRSWRDSNADGYGDIPGITGGLDYLSWLGVDAVWLSPTMPSPDDDWGYDVSDYTGVHPELGTMADLDGLIAAAGQRGIRVLLDLVPNHTSSAHAWFIDAASSRGSEHRDYYVWADPAPDGSPPNNWRDATGASAWAWHEPTGQYYLHNFLETQPDLNWWLPEVHEQFAAILAFWFDRGVAGFRVDVANGLYKDAQLRDNPPDDSGQPLSGRYGLKPVYNTNQPEVHGVYREWRAIAERYQPPRLLLGETWVPDARALAPFFGQDDELQLAFDFPFIFSVFTAGALSAVVASTLAALPDTASPVWTASNHDVGRFATRWCGGDGAKIRLALLVLATLPGAFVLYYGDEIGMTDVAVPPGLQRDKMTRGNLGGQLIRDRARTPMQWDTSPSAGFTAPGVTPWLPVGNPAAANVAAQRGDPGSVLEFCRALISVRKAELGGGGEVARYQQHPAPPGLWVYRCGGLLVAANFTSEPAAADLTGPGLPGPGLTGTVLLSTGGTATLEAGRLSLGAWQGLIARAG